MSKENRYKKWSVRFHQNEDKISRGIGRSLTVLFLALIGAMVFYIVREDVKRANNQVQAAEQSPISAVENRDYGESGFRLVAENEELCLYADFTTGEIGVEQKASGKIWYSNPVDRAEDTIVALKSRINSQLYVSYYDIEAKSLLTTDNYSGSIQKGGMEIQAVENGIRFQYSFPVLGIILPVQYTLNEEGMLAEILADDIEELWSERYVLASVDFLPFFGAGGLSDEGYLMVPDGSGALIEFNNEKQRFQEYSETVYGSNPTVSSDLQNSVRESITMPVYGVKWEDNAFLAMIVSGDGNSRISASVSCKTSSYNQVYSSVTFREHSRKTMKTSSAITESIGFEITENLLSGQNYSVQYCFLQGEDADYAGMSQVYREYLIAHNLLNRSELAEKAYLVLDLYGAVSIDKIVLGVEKPVVTALTTYQDVCEIVKQLKAQGVENLIINYIGALEGGLENEIVSKVSPEPVLGTQKEFGKMLQYLEEEGVILFIETNPIELHEDGNGYDSKGDSVKTFFGQSGLQNRYYLNTRKVIKEDSWYLMRPQLVPQLMRTYTASAMDAGLKRLSLYGLGDQVYSNYEYEESFTSREETLLLWKEILQDTANTADMLMVHGGNAYSFPYVDLIADVSNSSSYFDMEDSSIPFYQMVLHGELAMAAGAINATVDYQESFLKALETGCNLKYNWIYNDITELVGTRYNDMVSYSYEYWLDTAVEQYHKLQSAAGELAGKTILAHEQLTEKVTLTRYESDQCIIVNYGEEPYSYKGHVIEGRDYLVIEENEYEK